MPSEVFPGVYQIVVPLPKNQLKAVNCYVIKSGDRHLLIDTGMNMPACEEALTQGLLELGADFTRLDYFITHLHADHMGLVSRIARPGSKVHFNAIEAEMMRESHQAGGFGARMMGFARRAGFSEDEIRQSLSNHPGMKFHADGPIDYTLVADGDRLEFGEFAFECVQTPGHSPGHLCLYARDQRLMLCGDHVLPEISPNIGAWTADENPLADYLESLAKVYALDVEFALPGHRRVLRDFHERIDELRVHHQDRLSELHDLLGAMPLDAYTIASRMKWDLKYDRWEDVHVMQKWFATGEAIAHLRYLEAQSQVRADDDNGRVYYWKC